MNIRVMN